MPTPSSLASNGLVKKTLAEKLLAEIMNGTLSAGTRIIEGKWAQHFGVAQGTIREAINLLERDGFVTKEGGRSARVIHLTEQDVVQLYQMRSAVEGLAANLAAQAQPDFSHLQSIVEGMRRAAKAKSAANMVDWDLKFHLELCLLSGKQAPFRLRPTHADAVLRLCALAHDFRRTGHIGMGQRPRFASEDRRSSARWRRRNSRAIREKGNGPICQNRIRELGRAWETILKAR